MEPKRKPTGMEPTLAGFSQCYSCQYFEQDKKCNAYATIPDAIFYNKHDHREAYDGDQGLRFYATSIRADMANDKRWKEITPSYLAMQELIEETKRKEWGENE